MPIELTDYSKILNRIFNFDVIAGDNKKIQDAINNLEGMFQSGTWTPELMDNEGHAVSSSTADGNWTKTGGLLTITLNLVLDDISTFTGSYGIIPLPTALLPASNSAQSSATVHTVQLLLPQNAGPLYCLATRSGLSFYYQTASGASARLTRDLVKSGTRFRITITYLGD